jgi:hypothetical protein
MTAPQSRKPMIPKMNLNNLAQQLVLVVVGCDCAAIFLGPSQENDGIGNSIAANHDQNQYCWC